MAAKPYRRTIGDINRRLASGEAVVLTASELCRRVRDGRAVSFADVDVVTAATCGLMSGTYAVLSFQFSEPNRFVRATRLFLNGVEGDPGPCPNERLGLVDAIVHGTRHSRDDARYGGGHLLRDIAAGKEIRVEVVTDAGETLTGTVDIHRMPHAVLHGSRHAFRNYVGFVNPGDRPVRTIFCSTALPPDYGGATACGCGEINPIQKDPGLRTIGIGTRVMLNGGTGFVTGLGTRGSPQRPCLTAVADMHGMNPDYMGGFQTSAGPEVIQTWAVPIPIVDEERAGVRQGPGRRDPPDHHRRAGPAARCRGDLRGPVARDGPAVHLRPRRLPDPSGSMPGLSAGPALPFGCVHRRKGPDRRPRLFSLRHLRRDLPRKLL